MAYRDLQAFLTRLEELGELHRVGVEVDPVLEIAEITNRVCKSAEGNKALLFENVKGSSFPVVTNMFGSRRRLCAALEIADLEDLRRRMAGLLAPSPVDGVPGKLLCLHDDQLFAGFAPRVVTRGNCQEVVERTPDLTSYTLLKNWPGDGQPVSAGRFFTLPLVITRDPVSGTPNCGMYRVEVFDGVTAGIHWRRQSGGAGHYRGYQEKGEPMPVAVVVGCDPVLIYAATVPVSVDEMLLAGFLRREPVELVHCLTIPLLVPASAELVIEGVVMPGSTTKGGAFGNHTGYYSPGGDVPVMRVTAITRRQNPVFPATVVGPPPMEDCFLAKATERLLLPVISRELPEVVDINLPFEGIFHGCAVISVVKNGPGHARKVMETLWYGGWLGASRLLLIVDATVDVQDLSLTAWKVINNVVWERDLHFPPAGADAASGTPGASPYGGMLGLDATTKLPQEMAGTVAEPLGMADDIVKLVNGRWLEYGL